MRLIHGAEIDCPNCGGSGCWQCSYFGKVTQVTMEKKVTKKTKVKVTSFRQRLRDSAENRLQQMESTVRILVTEALKSEGTEVNPYDVMRLACGSQTKTLRTRLVTELANETERELERLYYNNQQQLPLDKEKSDAG